MAFVCTQQAKLNKFNRHRHEHVMFDNEFDLGHPKKKMKGRENERIREKEKETKRRRKKNEVRNNK